MSLQGLRKRSMSPEERDRNRQRKRPRRDQEESDRHPSRDRRSERARSAERGLGLSAEDGNAEHKGLKGRWYDDREPELSSGGPESSYPRPLPMGGRGHLTMQGRTGRAPFGGPAGRGSEAGGGRWAGRLEGRGFGEALGGRGGEFPGRGRGRGFFPRGGFPGRERGRFPGRWGGRGRMGMSHQSGVWGARGGRFEGPAAGELGPNGMRSGRGFGRLGEWQGMDGHADGGMDAGPPHPAIDPAVLDRRKKSIAARLRRQLAGLQVPVDLVEEGVLERLAEIKGSSPNSDATVGTQPVPSSYMFKAVGADERDRLPICQQRFDQTQAFEYCLQLYQSEPDIQMSKYGNFASSAAALVSTRAPG